MTGTLLEQEIHQQPATLTRLLANETDNVAQIAATIKERKPSFVLIAARGTSDNAAIYGKYALGAFAGLPVALAAPSVTTYYGKTPNLSDALVIGISQSGQGEDIRVVVEQARQQGAMTLGITNEAESPLAAASEYCVPLHAGPEKSLAATKTFTAQLTVMAMLAAYLSGDDQLKEELAMLPDVVAHTLALSANVPQRAERYRYMSRSVSIGRGFNYAVAFELAIKLKELTYIGVTPYSSADFRHGPIAEIDDGFPAICISPKGIVHSDMLSLMHDLRDRNAELIVVSNDEAALDLAKTPLEIPDVPEWLSPIPAIIPGQLLAFGVSSAKGIDVDNPRALKKVTSTK